jgi:hypothetical protein
VTPGAMPVVPRHQLSLELLLLAGQGDARVLHLEEFKLLTATVRV